MAVVYGKDTPKLGFGLMRLPKKGLGIDVEQVKTMVDLFLEAGFTPRMSIWDQRRRPARHWLNDTQEIPIHWQPNSIPW